MARIFAVLASVAWLSLVVNFFLGLWIGDFNAAAATYSQSLKQYKQVEAEKRAAEGSAANVYRDDRPAAKKKSAAADPKFERASDEMAAASAAFRTPRQRMTLHFYTGVAASILVILVNSVTVTYFVGTSRWCKEVAETYDLPAEMQLRSTAIKRRTFPWAFAGMLAMIGLALLGSLSDPSIELNQAVPGRSASMVQWHYLAAMGALAFIALTFAMQALRIAENYQAIEAILTEVRRIRLERGLPVSEAA